MSGTGIRAQNRAAMQASILRLGREHLQTHGAAGLSLRAIARDLGVVSSAVYRYVPSRDDLLTLLLVEAYTDLADAVDTAVDDVPTTAHRDRIRAAGVAVRTWAVADKPRWTLLYGSPVPGYAAPAEQTIEPGTRVIGRLLRELGNAHEAGALRTDLPTPNRQMSGDLSAIRSEFAVALSDATLVQVTTLWSTLIGGVSLEIFGQHGDPGFNSPAALFEAQIEAVLDTLFGPR